VVLSARSVGPRLVRPALDRSVDEAGDARSPRQGIKAPSAPSGTNISIAYWTRITMRRRRTRSFAYQVRQLKGIAPTTAITVTPRSPMDSSSESHV
jgi:hypothetical protein